MKNKIYAAFAMVLGIILISSLFYNIKYNAEFMRMPIYNFLNIVVAMVVAFFFAQMKTDERKFKERLQCIIEKLQTAVVLDAGKEAIASLSHPEILNLCRKLNNIMKILKDHKSEFDIVKEVEYLDEQVTDFREVLSERSTLKTPLADDYYVLAKYITNIDHKCDEILMKLYMPNKL